MTMLWISQVGRRCLLPVACLAGMSVGPVTTGWTRDVYSWSHNVAIAPFDGSRQQGETALVTDSRGRVWLSFSDAEYKQMGGGFWFAWPRTLRLYLSVDAGRTFSMQPPLSTDSAGDEALAADSTGRVYASFANYFTNPSRQQIVLRRLDTAQAPNAGCLLWDPRTKHDQSNVLAQGAPSPPIPARP